jgi:hypothetical protein
VSTSLERPLRLNGSVAGGSHDTHGLARQDLHATESDKANVIVGRHPAENDYDPVQTAYVPQKEPTQPTLEDNFALSENAPQPDYLAHRDALRGPRTMIKITFLVIVIFAVPMAYSFWAASQSQYTLPPEVASFNSRPIIPPPKPSSEEETTTARDDDPGTRATGGARTAKSFAGQTAAILQDTPAAHDPHSSTAAGALDPSSQQERAINRDHVLPAPAKGEPETAKSFASERLATLLPGAPGDQDPPSSTAVRPLDAEEIKFLMKHGEQFIAAGDVVTARLAFQRAAEAGDLNAAVALGATYDPTVLAKLGVVGISADVAKARSWYQKAEKLGSPEARRRLEVLVNR